MLYAYTRNRPTNRVDRLGLQSLAPGTPGSQPTSPPGCNGIDVLKPVLIPAIIYANCGFTINCICTMLHGGPAAPGYHYELSRDGLCVSVVDTPIPPVLPPVLPPPPPPPPPPFAFWCGNNEDATGKDIELAETFAQAICAGGLWPGNLGTGLNFGQCWNKAQACITAVDQLNGSKDDLCKCLLDAAGNPTGERPELPGENLNPWEIIP